MICLTYLDKQDVATGDIIEASTLGGPIIGAGNVSLNSVVILVPKTGLLSIRAAPMQDGYVKLYFYFSICHTIFEML